MTRSPRGATEAQLWAEDAQIVVEDVHVGGSASSVRAAGGVSWLLASDNILILESGAGDILHEPAVRVEAWEDAPPEPTGQWDDRAETQLCLGSGEVGIFGLTGGEPESTPLPVGRPGTYRVRAHRTGGRHVAGLAEADPGAGPEAIPRGVERFLVQLWPVHTAVPSG
ncbi:hypothetical protein [Streptomyces sp. 8N706]|uniref:hypothetical protein n=1 Tax=Streptomyces sp. 8N706 TaxID=3457416 RepID=UPI003FD52DCC